MSEATRVTVHLVDVLDGLAALARARQRASEPPSEPSPAPPPSSVPRPRVQLDLALESSHEK